MKSLLLSVGVFLVVYFQPVMGKGESTTVIQDLVRHIETRYAQTQDFQADFTQETAIEGFETPLMSSGRVYVKKPGLLRWDYLKPSIESIYVNGDHVDMFVPEHNQLIKGSLTHMVATQAPLRLLQGVGKLSEHFDVLPTGQGEQGEGGLPLLTLIPKEDGGAVPSPVSKIVSEIQPQTYFIKTLALHETTGNVSTFRFSDVQTNTGLRNTVFEFIPPEGIVIVEDVFPQ